MRVQFNKQMETLNNELIKMGGLIEKAIEMAVTALVKQDVELAGEAIRFDEEIDNQEKEVESLCMKLLMKQQPVAKDLRLISAAMKMITDMERIGDHAADISEITILLAEQSYIKKLEHIQQMAKETTIMVVKSVDAFVGRNMEMAKEVIAADDIVDDLFCEIKKDLIQLIAENPDNGEQAADLLMIAKYFERIGDHATNIAEWVIFSVTGSHEAEEV
ncbi:MAG: phosphate signaling complex protein PhoU [Lachnospiraceae bacterium]|nr:phosphate signaling complex protein PhoU [Lachnospiraceae bacterium]